MFTLLDTPTCISNNENIVIKEKLSIPVSINRDSIAEPLPVTIFNGIISKVNLKLIF